MILEEAVQKQGFKSVGEFIELMGGIIGMINIGDYDNASSICESFAINIGHILNDIGYTDQEIDEGKTMIDFYNEYQLNRSDDD